MAMNMRSASLIPRSLMDLARVVCQIQPEERMSCMMTVKQEGNRKHEKNADEDI